VIIELSHQLLLHILGSTLIVHSLSTKFKNVGDRFFCASDLEHGTLPPSRSHGGLAVRVPGALATKTTDPGSNPRRSDLFLGRLQAL